MVLTTEHTMIYTIMGSVAGASVCYLLAKCNNVSTSSMGFFPSPSEFYVICGFVLGAAVGFGYGSGQLIAGTHPLNHIH